MAPSAFVGLQQFLDSEAGKEMSSAGQLIATWFPDADEFDLPQGFRLAEHEPVPFPSVPAEWPAEMLAAAGSLTLDLAEQCLPGGWVLKDATPLNVLFRGPEPVFVDVLSFQRQDPHESIWPAYAQFVRTFLLPLLACRATASSLPEMCLARRDGLEPNQVYRLLSWWQRLAPPGLLLASIPTWTAGRSESDSSLYSPRPTEPERAAFTLNYMFRRLRRQLKAVSRTSSGSHWSNYLETQTHYTRDQFAEKESFVKGVLGESGTRRVLDIGANTGHFSELAARAGASVVAIDSDSAAAGRIWQRAVENSLDILPLLVDFCRPTPALGWRNLESGSFLDRAHGHFDLVMMLAVVHHMLITERVPLEEILDAVARITTDLLLIEFIEPPDPMFRRLVRGRDALYAHLTALYFESACAAQFDIVRKQPIGHSSRTLYLLRRKN